MSIASVTERISSIQTQISQLSGMAGTDAATAAAFGDQLSTALGTSGALGRTTTNTASPQAATVIQAASTALGKDYVWGGNSLATGVDCSGLVQQAFKTVGIELPRLSADQARAGVPVASMDQAQPGDLIAWDNSGRNVGADHIAIYLGNGKMIEAPRTGEQVRIVDVPSTPDYIRRVLGTTASTAGPVNGVPTHVTVPDTGVATARSAFDLQSLFAGVK